MRAILAGHPVLAYHATRLLPYEFDGIRSQGLTALSDEAIEHRLKEACEAGYLRPDERDHLALRNALTLNAGGKRRGHVCLSLGRNVMDDGLGLERLMGLWGGEAIYWAVSRDELGSRLARLGTPAIVVAEIDLDDEATTVSFPDLASLCFRCVVGESAYSDLFHLGSVPMERILDIWTPGHPEYDRHAGLPR